MNKKKIPVSYNFNKKKVFCYVKKHLRIGSQSSGKKFDVRPVFSTKPSNYLLGFVLKHFNRTLDANLKITHICLNFGCI